VEPPLSEESEEEEKRRLEAKSREHRSIHRDFFIAITSHLDFLLLGKILTSYRVKKKKNSRVKRFFQPRARPSEGILLGKSTLSSPRPC
jgi:hypothetical protein